MRRLASTLAFLGLLITAACSDDGSATPTEYRAQVRWTSFGIPHYLADDMASVAYAAGYVESRDVVCILADQFVRLRAERSKYFGPGELDVNLNSDFGMQALGVYATALDTYPELDSESRELIVAYTAGYNRYVEETPPANFPAPCRDADWVKPIEPVDLWAYYYWLSMEPSFEKLLDFDAVFDLVAQATPPESTSGSNGWAIGKDRSENGRGMLLANPHLPWQGARRLYERQITVPGMTNVYGVGWTGMPVITIGFNEHLAWTQTASTGTHATAYRLQLVPGSPTRYVFDGEERDMTARTYQVEVKQPDGSFSVVPRTLYRSQHGPVISGFGAQWIETMAHSFRNANERNTAVLRTYLRMNRAGSLAELEASQADTHGLSSSNIIAASSEGKALYFDASRTPALSAAAERAFREALENDYETRILHDSGLTTLPGNSSLYDWQDRDPRVPGLLPHAEAPRLERSDFVMNANDSHWLTHPQAPLTGYSSMFGYESRLRSPRTRLNLKFLTETGPGAASGDDRKFSFAELSAVPFNNRALLAELLRDAVVARCTATPAIEAGGSLVDLGPACTVLAAWDLRLDSGSPGAPLWREFLANFTSAVGAVVFEDGFDPSDPIGAPHTLLAATPDNDVVLAQLAGAVLNLESIGAGPSSTLAELQFTQRGGQRIPIHGGSSVEGAFNIVGHAPIDGTLLPGLPAGPLISALGLTTEGYPINFGTSFMLVTSFTDQGPEARALLSYSQSADPDSPHYADQTQRFADKAWREVRFRERDIAADPALREEPVSGPRW